MEHSNGAFEWSIQMEHSNGAFKWSIRMEHSNGAFEWSIRMEHSNGAFEWGIRMEHSNGAFDRTFIDCASCVKRSQPCPNKQKGFGDLGLRVPLMFQRHGYRPCRYALDQTHRYRAIYPCRRRCRYRGIYPCRRQCQACQYKKKW